jgi:hypothetical protein
MPAYTWTTGETITAAKLQALEDEAWRVANQLAATSSTSESSTSSSSYVDAAASVTFTAKSTSVYVQISGGGLYGTTGSNETNAFAAIQINGTDYAVTHNTGDYVDSAARAKVPFCGGVLVTGLTAGNSYTAKLRIRTGGTGTAYVNSDGSSRQTITVWDISK